MTPSAHHKTKISNSTSLSSSDKVVEKRLQKSFILQTPKGRVKTSKLYNKNLYGEANAERYLEDKPGSNKMATNNEGAINNKSGQCW